MVEGMETIVVTVSGYHGSERLKLVKLIAATGANYVGKMSKSTTHLVCWKFKGDKYELAKKFGTLIVNHQWFVDCFKEGKRIPELPYTRLSGQEAGFCAADFAVAMEKADVLKENSLVLNKSNMLDRLQHVIDLDSDEIENDYFHIDWKLNENLIPKPGSKTSQQRIKRKAVKETSSGDWRGKAVKETVTRDCRVKAGNRRSLYKPDMDTIDMFDSDASDDFLNSLKVPRRVDNGINMGCHLGVSSRRSRRLVKKDPTNNIIDLAATATESDDYQQPTVSSLSDDSNESREKIEASTSRLHETTTSGQGKTNHNTTHMDDIAPPLVEICIQSAQGLEATGAGEGELMNPVDHCTEPTKSVELSCVICWAEFSSTRGVLPCGHRFCFTCIKDWADYMASDRKESTCPLCKASFASITRVDGGDPLDQKVYSQSIPLASSTQDIFFVPEAGATRSMAQVPLPSACCHCQSSYPVDLLIHCQVCQISCIHSYCLDPPLFPWTCVSCRDRRSYYHY